MHVLDVAAWETMQALAAAGLITMHARVTRPLHDQSGAVASAPVLTAEQQGRCATLHLIGQRKSRAARALLAADLGEESLAPLREAALAQAQATSIARRLPEPTTLEATLHSAYTQIWPADCKRAITALVDGTIAGAEITALLAHLTAP